MDTNFIMVWAAVVGSIFSAAATEGATWITQH